MATSLRIAATLALGALSACRASRAPAPCSAPGTCASGHSCLVGTCRPADAQVVSSDARRIVLTPTQVAVLCGGRKAASAERESAVITFPGTTCRRPTLLLGFDVPWAAEARVAAAFLVLAAVVETAPSASDVHLEVAPVLEHWSSFTLEVLAPSTGRALARGVVSAGGGGEARAATVRLDVTSLVSGWSRRTLDDHGMAVTAEAAATASASLATGARANAGGPRLDVYLR